MSRVFVAFDRPVVVKVLPDEIATAISRERFRREILTSATLRHPNIVPVISAGDRGGLIHFIMPFADGFTAQRRAMPNGANAQRRKWGAQSASRAMVSCWRLR